MRPLLPILLLLVSGCSAMRRGWEFTAAAEVFDIANQVGAEIVTEPSTNSDILAQLNDPTAWVAPLWENGEMVLFFHSQALRGLEVLVTTDVCEMGTCGGP